MRSEEAELALKTAFLRRSLSLVGVRAQARLLLGRLEVIGPGAAAAAGRRNHALQQERVWANPFLSKGAILTWAGGGGQ